MSYQRNPFDQEEVNPFADPAVRSGLSGRPDYTGGAFFNPHAGSVSQSKLDPFPHEHQSDRAFNIPLGNENDLIRRERELEAKEAELVRREQELLKKEAAAARAGIFIEARNWPPFFPIIHNDIARDIPAYLQRIQYRAFASFLGILICLLWNLISVMGAWIRGENPIIVFFALIYLITGGPGSYVLWYRPLYRAMRTESLLNFGWFFLIYVLHILFVCYAAIAPPIIFKGYSLTGFITALGISDTKIVGILYFVGACCFTLEALLSIYILKLVFSYFRGSGRAAEMKRESMRGASGASL